MTTKPQTDDQTSHLETPDPQLPEDAAKKVAVKSLLPQSLSLEQHSNNSWLLVVQAGSCPNDYHQNPAPFEIIADQFHRFDTIKFVEAGGKWWGEGLVTHADPKKILCHMLRYVNLHADGDDQTDVPIGFEVRPSLPSDGQAGWVVVRRSNGVVMNAGITLDRRADAVRFIRGHNAA